MNFILDSVLAMHHDEVLNSLPTPLRERSRWIRQSNSASGELVLYWMQTAIRAEENPALEAAKFLAIRWNQPLLVYQGLSQRYLYASDRHHTFILEGVRDVQAKLNALGICYAFYLETGGQPSEHLGTLADRASVVVTEDMPTLPSTTFRKGLSMRTRTSILSVDTACIAPMKLIGQPYERAFQFRDAVHALHQSRIAQPWPIDNATPLPFDSEQLPFASLDLKKESISELVGKCDIDHLVGPVLDTHGGSDAGYERWNQFLDNKLTKYAKRRNDPLSDGVSRISAYLHYGMVSPFRIAREAHQQNCEGARKFLDEMLVWREIAYSFCFYRPNHDRWSVIPGWARATLTRHERDPRQHIYHWEQFARAQTHDSLWNAAQQSLLIHGELHNNVRMTWGKAFLAWTSDAVTAMRFMIDLNHRYALDGRDPCSYGGLLWCLGLFDRPFQPEIPVLGTVRPRPIQQHASRLNVQAYKEHASKTRSASPPSIAIIGAGISGAVVARTLADHGLQVTLFDKSHGVGGRMSTRRYEFAEFDHGAQYFTARDATFRRYMHSWQEQGIVARWQAHVVAFDSQLDEPHQIRATSECDRFVGVPSMNALVKHLLQGIPIQLGGEIANVQPQGNQFALNGVSDEFGTFDRVIVATPAPQANQLLALFPEMTNVLSNIALQPCWCLMMRLGSPLPVEWDAAFVNGGPLRWIARNQTKPGRAESGENIVVHASSVWSEAHLDFDKTEVERLLKSAFWKTIGIQECDVAFSTVHRWRYSVPDHPIVNRCVFNSQKAILACGDWAGGPKVEGAFLSGCATAGHVLRSLPHSNKPAVQAFLF